MCPWKAKSMDDFLGQRYMLDKECKLMFSLLLDTKITSEYDIPFIHSNESKQS